MKASKLGMEIDGHGFLDYNNVYGNTYLWLEDYQFTLFISDYDNTIKACYSCHYDGEETTRNAGTSLKKLEAWASRCSAKSEKKEENS